MRWLMSCNVNGYLLFTSLQESTRFQNIELASQSKHTNPFPPPVSQITHTITQDPLNLSLAGLWPGMRGALTNQRAVCWPSDQSEAGARTGSECHLSSSALRQAKQRPSNTHRRHKTQSQGSQVSGVGSVSCQSSEPVTWRLQCCSQDHSANGELKMLQVAAGVGSVNSCL